MSNSKSKFKKIICSTVLCFGMLASGIIGTNHFSATTPHARASASTSGEITEIVTSDLFGSGYNFDQTTATDGKPKDSVTGWTKDSSSDDSDNLKYGVVNFKDDDGYDSEEWGVTTKPEMPTDNRADTAYYKNLMINSQDEGHKFGFNSNKSISLEANSYYAISVYLYTHKDASSDPNASIYLDGILTEDDDNYKSSMFENITTLGAWEKYTFYVDTSSDSKTVTIGLWLGTKTTNSKGAVFFNNVEIIRYSEASYYNTTSQIEDNDNDNHNIISFSKNYTKPFDQLNGDEYTTDHSSFEDSSASIWTKKNQSTTDPQSQMYKIINVRSDVTLPNGEIISAPGSNGSVNNTQALFMYNKSEGYQSAESPKFTIGQLAYYRLSFWAKSDCDTGDGATVLLVDKSEKDAISDASITLSTTTETNKYHNDWTQYNFYIYGASQKNTQVAVQVWLGTQDDKTDGYVFVDDFRLEEIDYDTYNSNSSASNSATFNLNNASDKYTIANGEFDKTQNSDSATTYPLTPASWTSTVTRDGKTYSGTQNIYSGIVDTDTQSFNKNKANYGIKNYLPVCPPAFPLEDSHNNVLMIGSSDELLSQTYTSSSFTLSADSYYTLSLYIMTDYTKDSSINNGARITLSSETKTIFDQYNIIYNDFEWHKISVNIKTGVNDESATLALQFENCTGHIFIDKVELRTITENIYNDELYSKTTKSIDLTYENFDNKTFGKITSDVETPNNWTYGQDTEEGVYAGIKNIDSFNNIPASPSKEKTYLYIESLHDGNYYYTSKEKYNFSSETFYKITLNVYTIGIEREEPNDNDKDGKIIYGASIMLTDAEDIILKGINTNGNWKTYTIYASFTEDVTSTIRLSLGSTDEDCRGLVLFDNLVISTFESVDDYNAEIEEAEEGLFATFTNYTPPEEEEDEESTPWSSSFNWLILPSLITGLAIIIAVIGYYIKKITFNRKPKIKTNYDRRKTLDKDIDKREKIALRQQIIDELRAELSSIDQEIADFNVLAEEKLNQIKEQIHSEQEELKKEKLEIEIRKKEATANREKQLKASPEFVSNTKAEREYNNFIAKLDRQEMAIQRKINDQEFKLATAKEINKEKLSKYTARQEYIRLQIAKIEAEIEEIARQEEEMWAEYKAAKADAKRRKAEYKAQVKAEKEKQAKAKKSATSSKTSTTKKAPAKTSKTSTPKAKSTKVEKVEDNSSKEN